MAKTDSNEMDFTLMRNNCEMSCHEISLQPSWLVLSSGTSPRERILKLAPLQCEAPHCDSAALSNEVTQHSVNRNCLQASKHLPTKMFFTSLEPCNIWRIWVREFPNISPQQRQRGKSQGRTAAFNVVCP